MWLNYERQCRLSTAWLNSRVVKAHNGWNAEAARHTPQMRRVMITHQLGPDGLKDCFREPISQIFEAAHLWTLRRPLTCEMIGVLPIEPCEPQICRLSANGLIPSGWAGMSLTELSAL
jgi:hypothetical protein